ncbi:MAG: family N-acetyltransferase [Rickettsiaceae bacterium]|jgi:putative acetyltransferase|nr:family N-acetyltransferase [Rickettsiaceae bacterium]
MTKIKTRPYQPSDARSLVDIYYHTIHNINSQDYSREQLNAWAPESCLQLDGWQKKWQKLLPIVAVIEDKIVGFAEFEDNGHIDCFYVHHQFQGRGIGSALIKKIEAQATQKNLTRIFAEVSITAKPFFLSKGFRVVKEQMKNVRNVELKNFVMEKV